MLPNADGSSGAITVSDNSQKSILLDKPYAASEEKGGSGRSGHHQRARGAAGVRQRARRAADSAGAFSSLLRARHRCFDARIGAAISRGVRRHQAATRVPGRGDRLYRHARHQAYNQKLSLKRAESIRDRLMNDGLSASSISVAGRGELDPAVPTAPSDVRTAQSPRRDYGALTDRCGARRWASVMTSKRHVVGLHCVGGRSANIFAHEFHERPGARVWAADCSNALAARCYRRNRSRSSASVTPSV